MVMNIKPYLASIGEDYEEFWLLCRTPCDKWTQAQQLLANMLESAMAEGLIRRFCFHDKLHRHMMLTDSEYRQKHC